MRPCTRPRPAARSSSRPRARRSCRIPRKGSSAGSTSARSGVSSRTRTKQQPPTASCWTIQGRPRRWDGARASECSTSTRMPIVRGRSSSSWAFGHPCPPVAELAEMRGRPPDDVLAQIAELRRIAIVPALNEEETVGRVIEEIRAFDPGFDIVVVDDGSTDRTAGIAADAGAHVLRLPFNLGIGGAVQTGYRFAFERGYDIAVQVDGDGQHDPTQLPAILAPVVSGEADLCVGSRFASRSGYQSSFARRFGIRLFAWVVSAVVRQKVTDTTSGFRAVNRKGIALFAADYPHDYPEVEATVLLVKHKLRLQEVPVEMRERGGGASSITALRSIYYMTKVLLAIFVGLFRRYVVPLEEEHR